MTAKPKIAAFGELLIRIQATANNLINGESLIYPGGSEANVLYALAQYGHATRYISAAPDNQLTKEILTLFHNVGTDTSHVILGGDRLGSYYLLSANGLSNGEVIYDRKYSSFSELKTGSIDWGAYLKDCTWLHWSALTPALSEELALLMEECLQQAKKMKIHISVDLNYRSKLWQYGKTPLEVMPALVQYCDVIMGNIWAANKMLGTSISDDLTRATPPTDYFHFAKQVAKEIFDQYPTCKHIANTFRFMDTANHNLLYGSYHNRQYAALSDILETHDIIDRIGSGDAFMAGLIHALQYSEDPETIIQTALQFGFDKLFVAGDFLKK